ncbi:MAG: thiamine pyrophosphate-dependent enzyme [Chloroflexota bacterium]
MAKLTGGEAVVKSLLRHDITTIFGLPGVQNDYFYNALYDEGGKIRIIHSRHEQGAAYMALGYAMSTDKVGLYNVVPGAGFLNTTCALSTAYGANAKVFCLTGEILSHAMGRGIGQLHEIPDQLGIMQRLTKYAAHIGSPAEAPRLINEAIRQLHSDRPRPVGVQIPMDILMKKTEVDLTVPDLEPYHPPVDLDAVDAAAKKLGEAKRPLIFVGGGAQHASEEVTQLAEMLQAPVVAYSMGCGVVDGRHYLSQFVPGGYFLMKEADAILAIGTRLDRPGNRWGIDLSDRLIHLNVDPNEHINSFKPNLSIVADSKEATQALIELVGKYNIKRESREDEMMTLKGRVSKLTDYLAPQKAYLKEIRSALPEDGIFVDEVTQIGFASRIMMPTFAPRKTISPGYQGTLGWGFATALGVKVAHPDKPVLAVSGDGGFMFTMPELATAVQHKIGLVTMVFNDGAFGNVRRMQKNDHGNRLIASDLQNPDFVKLAEAFGAQGLRANSPEALKTAIEKGFATPDVPTIIDVPVGEMPSPWPLIMNPSAFE